MKVKDIKHAKLVPLKVTNGLSYYTILGTSIVSKSYNGSYTLYTYEKGKDCHFYKDKDGIIVEFKTVEEAERLLLKLATEQLQKSLFWVRADHLHNIEKIEC